MLPAPAVAWLVPSARARGDAVGLWVPGGTLGDAAGPSMAPLAPRLETFGSSIPVWGQAMPPGYARGTAVSAAVPGMTGPCQAPSALGAPLGAGSSTVLRGHPAWQGSWGGKERAVGVPSTHRLPRQRCHGSALLVFSSLQPAASHPASPQPLHAALGSPKMLPPTPPFLGDHSRSPGRGCGCRQGLRLPPFPGAGSADDALQLLCRLQAGILRRLGRPISRIGMCGLKSILLVQLYAARCRGLRGWWVPGGVCGGRPPPCQAPAFLPLVFRLPGSSHGPGFGGALPVKAPPIPIPEPSLRLEAVSSGENGSARHRGDFGSPASTARALPAE